MHFVSTNGTQQQYKITLYFYARNMSMATVTNAKNELLLNSRYNYENMIKFLYKAQLQHLTRIESKID